MLLENQQYSLGGTETHRKILRYDFDLESKEISNLWIYDGPISLDDEMFIPSELIKEELTNINDIRDSILGLKLKLSTENDNIKNEEIKVVINGVEVN